MPVRRRGHALDHLEWERLARGRGGGRRRATIDYNEASDEDDEVGAGDESEADEEGEEKLTAEGKKLQALLKKMEVRRTAGGEAHQHTRKMIISYITVPLPFEKAVENGSKPFRSIAETHVYSV